MINKSSQTVQMSLTNSEQCVRTKISGFLPTRPDHSVYLISKCLCDNGWSAWLIGQLLVKDSIVSLRVACTLCFVVTLAIRDADHFSPN